MSRTATPYLILAFTVAAIVVVLVAVTGGTDEPAGPEEGVTLQEVIEDPDDFAGERVTVSGAIETNDYLSLADARLAFVLGDDTSGSVLVLPQPGTQVPNLTEDAVVRVEGIVRRVPSAEATDGGVLNRGGLLSASGADAMFEATRVTIPAGDLGDEPADPPVRQATIEQLLADPDAWDERPLRVRGAVQTVTDAGFVISEDGSTIFVGAINSDLSDLQAGDRVELRAELARISQWRADTIAAALQRLPRTDAGTVDLVDPADIPADVGDVFLLLRTLERPGAAVTS